MAASAIDLLIEHQAANPKLTPQILDRLSFTPHPQMDKFLTRVAAEKHARAVQIFK